jgi:hypothetical protein
MTITTPMIKHRAICKIPGCGYFISRSPLDIPVIGAPPGPGLIALAEKMGEHLATAHPGESARLGQSIQLFAGYLMLAMFTLEDPRLLQEFHYNRSIFHTITTRYNVTDEEITKRLELLEFEPEDQKELQELIQDLRDLLTEKGAYSPSTNHESLVKL